MSGWASRESKSKRSSGGGWGQSSGASPSSWGKSSSRSSSAWDEQMTVRTSPSMGGRRNNEPTPFSAHLREQQEHSRDRRYDGSRRSNREKDNKWGWQQQSRSPRERQDGEVLVDLTSKSDMTSMASRIPRSHTRKRANGADHPPAPRASSSAWNTSLAKRPNNLSMDQYRNRTPTMAPHIATNKTWDQMTWAQKLTSQFPPLQHKTADDLPAECLKEDDQERIRLKHEAAKHAIQQTLAFMGYGKPNRKHNTNQHHQSDADESDFDSDDAMAEEERDFHNSGQHYPYTKLEVQTFFQALPNNLIFSLGFDVSGLNPTDEINCYCPCSKHMAVWRTTYKLQFAESDNHAATASSSAQGELCENSKKMAPIGLMGHLTSEQEKGKPLHHGIKCYLEFLYASHNNGRGHKALYKMGDLGYKLAEAAEKKEGRRLMLKLRQELDEERRRAKDLEEKKKAQEEAMEKLKMVNEELHENVKSLNEMKEYLGVKPKEAQIFTDDQLRRYKQTLTTIFQIAKNMIFEKDLDIYNKKDKITLHVGQQFRLESLFNEWARIADTQEKTFLFRPLKNLTSKKPAVIKHLIPWNVQYSLEGNITNRTDKEALKAEDAGGPSREFLSQTWNQLGDLCVLFDVKNSWGDVLEDGSRVTFDHPDNGEIWGRVYKISGPRGQSFYDFTSLDGETCYSGLAREMIELKQLEIPLFERVLSGFIPINDDMLQNKIDIVTKKKYGTEMTPEQSEQQEKLLKRIKSYYKAVGRIMIHAIAINEPISSIALPRFFRNYVFRDTKPQDEDYHDDDVLDDLLAIGVNVDKDHYIGLTFNDFLSDGDEEKITKENLISQGIYKIFIKTRMISLTSLKEGITLGGTLRIENIFRSMPVEVMSKIAFSNPHTSAKNVIDVLTPVCSHDLEGNDASDEMLTDDHKAFIKDVLSEILLDREKDEMKAEATKEKSLTDLATPFSSQFVAFCTGSCALPYREANPTFRIAVEFSSLFSDDHLPYAHTCVNTLKLPFTAYGNDREVFEKKLEDAIYGTKNAFGMR